MAKEQEKQGKRVTLFAPRASVERLQRAIPSVAGLMVHDFATLTTPELIKQGLPRALKWLEQLPDLDGFESVICDNLPEILSVRPDATISAQFFWHDVIEGASKEYANYCDELLERHKPKVIGCEFFTMESVRKQQRYESVSLYENPELVAAAATESDENRTDLLVTGGTTPAVRERLQLIIEGLLKTGPGIFKRVFVDSELMPKEPPSWLITADFSVEMFCKLKAAVCRPGLGVITDLITAKVTKILPIYEEGNQEMWNNAKNLDLYIAKNKGSTK